MEKRKIIVYSGEWCPWCDALKSFLKKNNIAFEARDVDDPKYAKEAMEKSNQSGIPITDVDGTIIVGFDEPRLREILGIKSKK